MVTAQASNWTRAGQLTQRRFNASCERIFVACTGVNGAGKTTQLQIITGGIEADGGEILKQKANMKIAYLTQEFDVMPSRTVRVSATNCRFCSNSLLSKRDPHSITKNLGGKCVRTCVPNTLSYTHSGQISQEPYSI